ncbi:hypothetical protein [Rothia nasimurium]|uniref:hypothetical protein n=1 Tax=Rothia nasimurium TaxID=85336 RepID=UPI00162A88E4|nr:hypothetical protein [Rothia nasimurium]
MRWIIRLTAFFLALTVAVLSLQLVEAGQKDYPLGAQEAYKLKLVAKIAPKEELLQDLQELTQKYQVTLVRPILDEENEVHNLAWFGDDLPKNLQINSQEHIYWLSDPEPGTVLPATELAGSPINGTYYSLTVAPESFKQEIIAWSQEMGLEVSFSAIEPKPLLPVAVLFTTAIGNTVLALLVLLFALIVAWVISTSKAQSTYLLGGIQPWRIQAIYTFKGSRWCLEGILCAGLAVLAYKIFTGYQDQLLLMAGTLAQATLLSVLMALVLLSLVLFSARPSLVHLAHRTFPYGKLKWIGAVARLAVLVLIMIIMPGTLNQAISAYRYQQDQGIWENYQDLYVVSLKNLYEENFDQDSQVMDDFISLVNQNKTSYLALNLGDMIEMQPDMLGGYEAIIVVNREWLQRQNIQLEGAEKSNAIQELSAQDLPQWLIGTADQPGQMSLWLRDGISPEEAFSYYVYLGQEVFIPGTDSAYGGEIHHIDNAIFIVPDKSLESLSTGGFLIPAMSSGNLFFSGKDNLESYSLETGFSRYIFAIDSFAQSGLEVLKEYREYLKYYVVSLIALCLAVLYTSYQSAAVWSNIYKKRIFTLRTSGIGYYALIKKEIVRELTLAGAVILALAIARLFFNPGIALEILTVTVLSLFAFCVALYLSYLNRARASFAQVSQRK